jgi:predicted nucleic acid-binding protein
MTMPIAMATSTAVLLDTNVIVDLLLQKQPFAEDANTLVLLIEDGLLKASLCANTVTTVDYLLASALGKPVARGHIKRLLKIFDIAPVNRSVLHDAAESSLKDFEDAVIAESAKASGITNIITRHGKDFVGCGLNVYSPDQWLAGYAG